MTVPAADVGGTHVKVLARGQTERREFASAHGMSAANMVERVQALTDAWAHHQVGVGLPGPVVYDRPAAEPVNLGSGWVGFDFGQARSSGADVVARLAAAMEPDEIVPGGGNAALLQELPPRDQAGDNVKAFLGGCRLWEAWPAPCRVREGSRAAKAAETARPRRPRPESEP